MSPAVIGEGLRRNLDGLYAKYNRREFVHPDPLEFLYEYDDVRDREVAGLIASSLAYGNVKQIIRSVGRVLERMGRPAEFLRKTPENRLFATFSDFRHRVTSGETLARLLLGVKGVIREYGTLDACFKAGTQRQRRNSSAGAVGFCGCADRLRGGTSEAPLGAACKGERLQEAQPFPPVDGSARRGGPGRVARRAEGETHLSA